MGGAMRVCRTRNPHVPQRKSGSPHAEPHGGALSAAQGVGSCNHGERLLAGQWLLFARLAWLLRLGPLAKPCMLLPHTLPLLLLLRLVCLWYACAGRRMQRPCWPPERLSRKHALSSTPTPTHAMHASCADFRLWRAQHADVEAMDHEREGDRAGDDSPGDWCLARLFARLHRLHHPQQPPSKVLSERERRLVQEAAYTAAHAVAREAADAAARALAPQVAQELARVVLRDVARAKNG